jgi:hypothetical protein
MESTNPAARLAKQASASCRELSVSNESSCCLSFGQFGHDPGGIGVRGAPAKGLCILKSILECIHDLSIDANKDSNDCRRLGVGGGWAGT